MILRSSIILFLACLAGGCNTTVTNTPSGTSGNMPMKDLQPHLIGMQNWQDLAEEMAEELAKRGELFKDGQIIVVQPSTFDTAFAKAYYKFVLKAFQDRNIPVLNEPNTVDQELILTLKYNVQNVRHMNPKNAAAVEGVGFGVNKIVTGEPARPVGGDAEEILVYTSVSDATKDVFVHTQIAYINVSESHFYLEQKVEKPKSLGTQSIPVINEKKI